MNNKGITLPELLIVIAIITILTSASFVGYGRRQKEVLLQKETNLLVAKAEQVREMAISAKHFYGDLPQGGYGVYFNLSQPEFFIVFADCDGDNLFDSTGTPCSGHSELVERVDLEGGVYIKNLCAPSVSITFVPPSPNVFIRTPGEVLIDECVLTLGIQGSTKEKKIHFNSAGLIYAE
ncbi:MAG: prepilin-type N-terminal cleavage/methylation domain-containing protein [Candidatus Pacebacteria bacterium]|nr:prepilin-type N-terminal cleavage/methylation domain-containing protein [Candidatus Paceibacterota bacterium]